MHPGAAAVRGQVRGPIVLQSYHKGDKPAVDGDGWFGAWAAPACSRCTLAAA